MRRSLTARSLIVIVLILGLGWSVGCKKKQPETTSTPEPTRAEPAPQPPAPPSPREVPRDDFPTEERSFEEPKPTIAELNGPNSPLKTVYFEFDKSDLSDATRAVLRSNASWMKTNQEYAIVVEGHCDERGTIEYNLALGQRRANSVREYLVSLGIPTSRLRIISYGEERPAMQGSNDSAWAKNRRAHFRVEQ